MHPPVVILAAGEGKRLSPLTNTRPKPMLPVANTPLLEYVLEAAIEAGADRIIFVVGYRGERIRNHFGDGDEWGISIEYVEQSSQLGTGHAILQVAEAVDERFLVLNGDRVIDPDVIDAVRAVEEAPAMAITRAEFPSTFGVVDVEGETLAHIEEKPLDPSPSALINAGVYQFDPSIFSAIEQTPTENGEHQISATLDRLAQEREIPIVRYDGTWLDVTYLWDLLTVNALKVDQFKEPHEGTVARDVALDRGVGIGPNATIGGGTAIGENVRIGANTVIDTSVVLSDAKIGAGSVLQDVIVGANASVGPNVTIEGGPASVLVGDRLHEDVTLGAVIGDNATIGGGAVLAPGTVIGDGARVASGTRVMGRVPPGSEVTPG